MAGGSQSTGLPQSEGVETKFQSPLCFHLTDNQYQVNRNSVNQGIQWKAFPQTLIPIVLGLFSACPSHVLALPEEVANNSLPPSSSHFLDFTSPVPQPSTPHVILLILTYPTHDFYTSRPEEPHKKHWVRVLNPSFQRAPSVGGLMAGCPPVCHLSCSVSLQKDSCGGTWRDGRGCCWMLPILLGWEWWESYPPVHP